MSGHLISADKGKDILHGVKEAKGDELNCGWNFVSDFFDNVPRQNVIRKMRGNYETELN
jgi:hypothetical protein